VTVSLSTVTKLSLPSRQCCLC